MNKNTTTVILGVLLIIFGCIFLGNNLGWFDIDISFRRFADWWPLLLILGGAAVFLSPERRFANPLTILCIAFAIPMALYSTTRKKLNQVESDINDRIDKVDVFRDDEPGVTDGNSSNQTTADEDVRSKGDKIEQNFVTENEPGLKKAKLDFGGGAAQFHLDTENRALFRAKTELSSGSYKLESDTYNSVKDIKFEMMGQKDGNVHIEGDENFDNDVYLKLNPAVTWDLDLGIGAGDLDFDLSKFNVENLLVESGVAAIKLKLSDLQDISRVRVKSGIARVKIEVPKGVGCEIKMDGALNTKTFSGFDKVGDSRWQTDNFQRASRKIFIDFDSGLSSISVSRY